VSDGERRRGVGSPSNYKINSLDQSMVENNDDTFVDDMKNKSGTSNILVNSPKIILIRWQSD
jgi:hypothetical protein